MRLAIFTHVVHKEVGNSYYGYGPYVREVNLWLQVVQKAEVVAPVGVELPTAAEAPYRSSNLLLSKIPNLYFGSAKGTIASLQNLPIVCIKIIGAMRRADHLHIRCPGNIGLISSVIQIFFPNKAKTAKYAGNWDPTAQQPWTYKFQKWLLSNTFLTRNMQVLVYGEWPRQTKNVRPFFTASFLEEEIERVRDFSFEASYTFLFVGNLVEGKRPLEAVKLVQELNEKLQQIREAIIIKLEIYGDGREKQKLKNYVKDNHLEKIVIFKGSRPLEELKAAYQKANFVILPSKSEGWPKAIAEGMFFGCIPIATPVSCVPWMLGCGSRGIFFKSEYSGNENLVEYGERKEESQFVLKETVDRIIKLMQNPEEMQRKSKAAKRWSQQYTLEKFEAAIKEVLQEPKKSSSPFGGGGGVG